MQWIRAFGVVVAGVALCSASGCSERFPSARVSGTVTLDGAPLEGASITFQPIADLSSPNGELAGPGSYAFTDKDGRYSLRLIDTDKAGAVIGKHRVVITTSKDTDQLDDSGVLLGERVPQPFRDGSTEFDVPRGGTDKADFVMFTKPSPKPSL